MQLTAPRFIPSFLALLMVAVLVAPAGGVEYKKKDPSSAKKTPVTAGDALRVLTVTRSLQPFYLDSGKLNLSVDAMGTNMAFGTVEIAKPEDAVVA